MGGTNDPIVDFDAAGAELLRAVQQVYHFRNHYFADMDHTGTTASSPAGNAEQVASMLAAKRSAVAERIDAVDAQIMQVYCACRKKKRRANGAADTAPSSSATTADSNSSSGGSSGTGGGGMAGSSSTDTSTASTSDSAAQPAGPSTSPPADGRLDGRLALKHKARYFFLRGFLHNCQPEHSAHAERWLEKSLKQEPRCAPAWNSLGESYWKRGDMENARICFESALKYERENSEAMRRLSIVLRQLGSTREEKRDMVEQSIQLGHDAAKVDAADGESWFVVGNAYLKRFFDFTHDMHDIKKALNAYNVSIKDTRCRWNADIYYSRAVLHEYLENFSSAVRDYQQAAQLDPSLLADVKNSLDGIYGHVVQTATLIAQRANWKAKRLENSASSIRGKCSASMSRLVVKTLSQLTDDTTSMDSMIFGKVLMEVQPHRPSTIRRSWLAIAPDEQIFEISVYNLAPGASIMSSGDEIVIAQPHLKRIHLSADYGSYTNVDHLEPFQSVRVENPLTLSIEGIAPRPDMLASVGMHVSARTEA